MAGRDHSSATQATSENAHLERGVFIGSAVVLTS
jgi:hypothetical protein